MLLFCAGGLTVDTKRCNGDYSVLAGAIKKCLPGLRINKYFIAVFGVSEECLVGNFVDVGNCRQSWCFPSWKQDDLADPTNNSVDDCFFGSIRTTEIRLGLATLLIKVNAR